MKHWIVALLLIIASVYADQVLHPKTADDMLDHLEGNNWNIYILFFAADRPVEEYSRLNNHQIESGIQTLLTDNPELAYARIDHLNPNFHKLLEVLGVTSAPSLFMMVHGKGVWITEGTSELMLDRLRDFLPAFKQASSHHEQPY